MKQSSKSGSRTQLREAGQEDLLVICHFSFLIFHLGALKWLERFEQADDNNDFLNKWKMRNEK